MRKGILTAIAALGVVVGIAAPAEAWTVYANHSWGAQIKCGGGSIRGIKQKSNGKWTDTAYNQNFGSFNAAANAACDGRGG
ncbi:MAG: hypothetical protein ACI82I_001660 [Gammaproteobacteria bacterium]|jgi:hypothetical protein